MALLAPDDLGRGRLSLQARVVAWARRQRRYRPNPQLHNLNQGNYESATVAPTHRHRVCLAPRAGGNRDLY